MLRVYLQSDDSLRAARRLYASESIPRIRALGIANPTVPNARTILTITQRLLYHGQFCNPSHAQGSGRPRLVVDIEEQIMDFFERDPRSSTYDAARLFSVSQNAVWKLLNTSGLHPYHYQPVQKLHDPDPVSRRTYGF